MLLWCCHVPDTAGVEEQPRHLPNAAAGGGTWLRLPQVWIGKAQGLQGHCMQCASGVGAEAGGGEAVKWRTVDEHAAVLEPVGAGSKTKNEFVVPHK